MDRRHFLALTLGVTGVALLSGCGGGGSEGGEDGFGRGAAAGYLFTDSAGDLIFGDSATPPTGATPASGVRLEIVNENVTGGTNAEGRFQLEGIRAGMRTLRMTKGSVTKDIP